MVGIGRFGIPMKAGISYQSAAREDYRMECLAAFEDTPGLVWSGQPGSEPLTGRPWFFDVPDHLAQYRMASNRTKVAAVDA